METALLICVWRCLHCQRLRETQQHVSNSAEISEFRPPEMCLCEESETFGFVFAVIEKPD